MSNDPKDPPKAPTAMYPFDKTSTGETSSKLSRAQLVPPSTQPRTGPQPAFKRRAPAPESALERSMKPQKTNARTTRAVEDTFVKAKMKQTEAKLPDFELDEDLG